MEVIKLPFAHSDKALFIFGAVLLALVVGVYLVFSIPTEVEEQVTVLRQAVRDRMGYRIDRSQDRTRG